MPAQHLHTRRTRRTSGAGPTALRRGLPALALGVTTLALALPTALPASAAPTAPTDSTTTAPGATGDQAVAKQTTAVSRVARLTPEAREAGVELGNAPMGWRQRGTERPALSTPKSPLLRYGAAAARSSSTTSFTPTGVLGVDVSSYQRNLTWSTWTKKDRDFAYIKATEGTSYRNPYFKRQYGGAKKAGLIRGAYHFASPSGKAGYLQARYFVKNGGGWSADGKTLPGVLDIEYNPYGKTCYGVSKKTMVRWVTLVHAGVQEAHRQGRRHLHDHRLVDAVHRQQQRLRRHQPVVDRALRDAGSGHPAQGLEGRDLLAVRGQPHRPGRLPEQARPAEGAGHEEVSRGGWAVPRSPGAPAVRPRQPARGSRAGADGRSGRRVRFPVAADRGQVRAGAVAGAAPGRDRRTTP